MGLEFEGLRIEGGGEDWGYHDPTRTDNFPPMSGMPEEYLQAEEIYLAPYGGSDAIGIYRKDGGIVVKVYCTTLPGLPNMEVDFSGNVEPFQEKCPSMSYKLGPESTLFLSYGQMERVVIATS